ncbi:MAG: hypothetical protein P1Q69_16845 [Candidatus Thorarchaeota archaeon]|nr:hypothetical protein [Candidatus Thorarchaeota archaeon]
MKSPLSMNTESAVFDVVLDDVSANLLEIIQNVNITDMGHYAEFNYWEDTHASWASHSF